MRLHDALRLTARQPPGGEEREDQRQHDLINEKRAGRDELYRVRPDGRSKLRTQRPDEQQSEQSERHAVVGPDQRDGHREDAQPMEVAGAEVMQDFIAALSSRRGRRPVRLAQ